MSNTKVICEKDDLVAIADSIRSRTGETGGITLGNMPTAIGGIASNSSKTCPVTVYTYGASSGSSAEISYTTIEEGVIKTKYLFVGTQFDSVDLDVLCGGSIFLCSDMLAGTTGVGTGGVVFEHSCNYRPAFVYTVNGAGTADNEP